MRPIISPSFLGPVVVLSMLSTTGFAARETVQDFSRRLEVRGSTLRTLQASFTQRKRLALFRTEITTKGKICYQRPDRLRWETFHPDASLMLVRGKRAELRLVSERPRVLDLKRNRSLGVLIEQMMSWFGSRLPADLSRWYQVKIDTDKNGSTLRLKPKDVALQKHVRSIAVRFGSDLSVRAIEISQHGGDHTKIDFFNIIRNKPLPNKIFD